MWSQMNVVSNVVANKKVTREVVSNEQVSNVVSQMKWSQMNGLKWIGLNCLLQTVLHTESRCGSDEELPTKLFSLFPPQRYLYDSFNQTRKLHHANYIMKPETQITSWNQQFHKLHHETNNSETNNSTDTRKLHHETNNSTNNNQ